MKLSASAPGKLVLFGEYAVLENSPAIVAAVNRRALITIEQSRRDHGTLILPHLKVSVPFATDGDVIKPLVKPETSSAVEAVSRVISMLNRMLYLETKAKGVFNRMSLTIDTSDFFSADGNMKMGLGSSAAITVGLLVAVRSHVNHVRINKHALMHDGYRHHNESQTQAGSGIDIAASVFGGILRYKLGINSPTYSAEIKQITTPEDLQMRFVWSGRPASTASFLKNFAAYREGKRGEFNRTMGRLIRLAQDGCEAFEKSNTPAFLQSVEGFYHCLENLSLRSRIPIISTDHRRIARIVYENGGYYKPSGAGGGDFGIIFGTQKSQTDVIAKRVAEAGYSLPNLCISADGVCVRHSKEG